ncbi:MAG: hypothetical protein V7603_5837 [Micromonosporaceae bacterium]
MVSSPLTGLAVALAVLAVATALGVWWRRRDGRLRGVRPGTGDLHTRIDARSTVVGSTEGDAGDESRALAALGVVAGPVTLLQFSSAFCAPCRVASRVCGEVARQYPGVVHIEIDAESHLAEVRRLGIWRTPTVLVVDTGGRVAHRSTGAPAKARVVEAVTTLLPVPT